MKRQDLTPKAARKFKCTTDSKHQMPVAPNLLAQNFSASAPNEKWAGDITYIATSEGWLYLAVIIDLYSRQVIGWSMDTRMTATLVCVRYQWRCSVADSPSRLSFIVIEVVSTAQKIIETS
jgi:transposase InsO family protein